MSGWAFADPIDLVGVPTAAAALGLVTIFAVWVMSLRTDAILSRLELESERAGEQGARDRAALNASSGQRSPLFGTPFDSVVRQSGMPPDRSRTRYPSEVDLDMAAYGAALRRQLQALADHPSSSEREWYPPASFLNERRRSGA